MSENLTPPMAQSRSHNVVASPLSDSSIPMRRAVVAIGGNALLKPGQVGHEAELHAGAHDVARSLVPLLQGGWRVALVHGNGPQVGIELVRSEEASTKVPPFGLDLCVANTQGAMGALLLVALRNVLHEEGLGLPVTCIVTLAEVAAEDPAFQRPTKPIGLFYSAYRAHRLRAELERKGWDIVEDAGRGYRPVVPSPRPRALLETPSVELLLAAGHVVVAGGGGGVAVARPSEDAPWTMREAVIDKDRTSALLARALGAELLVFLTGVDQVDLNHGTTLSRRLERLHPSEARRHHAEGQFPPGSMGPKVEAAWDFAEAGGTALITSAASLHLALVGRAGTRITIDDHDLGPAAVGRQLALPLGLAAGPPLT